jgi:SAM-dependent MidA family methyltransferase
MTGGPGMQGVLHNLLQYGDLSFRDFMEVALYHPEHGYYSKPRSPVGKTGDYVTSPSLSPLFAFALGRLVNEFLSRGEGVESQIVDIGCGDGALIHELSGAAGFSPPGGGPSEPGGLKPAAPRSFVGVDRSGPFARSLADLPPAPRRLIISNELFDALPFARVVRRGEELHELWVTERDGALDWSEHEAEARYGDYFAARGISLQDGQFADLSLEWEALYDEICRSTAAGLIVTFDYGDPSARLFRGRARHFGTAAAYSRQRVSRDLLANPGEQDLTAHINFDDLRLAGERNGFTTLFFDVQAKFLLSLGAAEHADLAPPESVEQLERREEARRLLLPDGIGMEIRVLVQGRGVPLDGWSFQKPLW